MINIITIPYSTVDRRSEESSVLIRDSYSWSHFFSRWETFNETPSLSPAYLTYSCNEGNIIAILSPPTPPPPSSDPMDATDITDSSSGDRSSQQLLALASDRKRTSNGELRERLMGPASTIVKIYSETPVVSSVICGRVLLGSGSVAVMEGREVGATLGKVVYYDNVHAWLVR